MDDMYNNLHVVSNRLPVTIKKQPGNGFTCDKSSGGLVSGLSGLSACSKYSWYGWPGLQVCKAQAEELKEKLWQEHNAVPCFVDDELADKHYNGFSNSVLWPLFHYQPGFVKYYDEDWRAYVEVNRRFAKEVASKLSDGDLIWVHDYHLMLLPSMLREETLQSGKTIYIGFFLHTPFPCADMFSILPVSHEILEGLLQSDLIGFHTTAYAKNFVSTCSTILNVDINDTSITYNGKVVDIGVYPIGIEPKPFLEKVKMPGIQEQVDMLNEKYGGRKILLGVDRMDYIKGLPQKLHAFEQFLRKHPEWVGNVVLVQIAVPSRQDLKETQSLTAELKQLATKINAEFGSVHYQPVDFQHKSLDFDTLLAYYTLADICIVASTRDGMNLVSYEYVAAQNQAHQNGEKVGALILSEFAGAAQDHNLEDGALLFNPWSVSALAETLQNALTMDKRQRKAKFEELRRHVMSNTSANWGKTFLSDLDQIVHRERLVKPEGKVSESDSGYDSGL